MAWTSVGFDGTITEIQWAGLASLLGNGYVAAGNGDCLVTAVGGARQVSVAAGSLYGDGVLSTNSGAETVALTTPTNGQWYVIALRRTWATNTAALVAIAGATTTTTTPTAPPTSFPTLNTNVGVLTDQPIAWAWCNSANTTVVVYDIRLKAVKSLPPVVATSAERDAKFMSPTQGLQVWRDDLGAVETYYGLYNSSTNPGGRDTAGWYVDGRAGGLIPISPSSVVVTTGTATANSMGQVSFSGASSVSLNNVFSDKYRNYRIVLTHENANQTGGMFMKYRTAGTDNSAANGYLQTGLIARQNSTQSYFNFTSTVHVLYDWVATAQWSHAILDIFRPFATAKTEMSGKALGYSSSSMSSYTYDGIFDSGTPSFDGFSLHPSTGLVDGTVQVFGYND